MPTEAIRTAALVRSRIEENARRLGFSADNIAAKLAKFDRDQAEHGEDMIAQVDTRDEALDEAHDLHNYLVTHAVHFGFYPDLGPHPLTHCSPTRMCTSASGSITPGTWGGAGDVLTAPRGPTRRGRAP